MAKRTPRKLIPKEEAALLLGRSAIAIYRLTQKRKIPFYRNEGRILFDPDELLEWAAKDHVLAEPNT